MDDFNVLYERVVGFCIRPTKKSFERIKNMRGIYYERERNWGKNWIKFRRV